MAITTTCTLNFVSATGVSNGKTVFFTSPLNSGTNYLSIPGSVDCVSTEDTTVFTLQNAQDLATAIVPLLVLAFVFRALRRFIF